MGREIISELKTLLAKGSLQIGQIICHPDFSIQHAEDSGKKITRVSSDPYQAAEIAKYDEEGHYRALKSAPNLQRGWRLELHKLEDLCLAIDFFYPLALAEILAFRNNKLKISSLREVLGRQTGMYAVTKKVTDKEAETITRQLCNPEKGCLRNVLWVISPENITPLTKTETDRAWEASRIPLLCPEPCCLVVAEARAVVKGRPATA